MHERQHETRMTVPVVHIGVHEHRYGSSRTLSVHRTWARMNIVAYMAHTDIVCPGGQSSAERAEESPGMRSRQIPRASDEGPE
jgi:hypothetical protein